MIVTEELAHDLLPDILSLLNSKRAFVRRKAVLCLFRIFKQYPPALEESYDKLVNLLVDNDISVQSSAVSVITELAREDPSRYQNLAPTIFTLLLNVENTWVLIKVIKLLMNLVTEEPRLAKKLLDPLVNVVRTAETKSLLYEAMMGVTQCLIYMPVKVGSKLEKEIHKVTDLLMAKFLEFVQDADPNLTYLGLCGLLKLVEVAPAVVARKSFVYVECLKANDSTIRAKALSLVKSIANTKNLKNLVEDLVKCLRAGVDFEMKEEILQSIVEMCSRDTYANTQDFTWYVSVLVDLAQTRGSKQGALISSQLIDVALRVPAIRLYMVNSVLPLLLQPDSVCDSMRDVLIISSHLPCLLFLHPRSRLGGRRVLRLSPAGPDRQRLRLSRLSRSHLPPSPCPGHVSLAEPIDCRVLQALLQVSLRFICSLGSASDRISRRDFLTDRSREGASLGGDPRGAVLSE